MKISSIMKSSHFFAAACVAGCQSERPRSLNTSISALQSDREAAKIWFEKARACENANKAAWRKNTLQKHSDFQAFLKNANDYDAKDYEHETALKRLGSAKFTI